MTDPSLTPKNSVRGGIVGIAAMSFAAGMMLNTAMFYVVKGDPLAWIFAACGAVMVGAVLVVLRRTLPKVP